MPNTRYEVKINILRGENIINPNSVKIKKPPNPYIVTHLLGPALSKINGCKQDFKEKYITANENPVWTPPIQVVYGEKDNIASNDVYIDGLQSNKILIKVIHRDKRALSKDDDIGRVIIDLSDMEKKGMIDGKTHQLNYPLEDKTNLGGDQSEELGTLFLDFTCFRLNEDGTRDDSVTDMSIGDRIRTESNKLLDDTETDMNERTEETDTLLENQNPPNELIIMLQKATDLHLSGTKKKKKITYDPYVSLSTSQSQDKAKSTVKKDTDKPIWNESFRLGTGDESDGLQIFIYDSNILKDDLLGKCVIPLFEVTPFKLVEKVIVLQDERDIALDSKLHLKLQWCYNPKRETKSKGILGLPFGKKNDSDDEKEDENENSDEDQEQEKTEEEKKAEEEKLKQIEEERKERMKRVMKYKVYSGDYQIQIHVIEGRDFVAKDANGLSDPVVTVSFLGKEVQTATKKACLSAVWDEQFIINQRNVDKDEFIKSPFEIKLWDADFGKRKELMGEITLDASYIYFGDDHEIYRKWLVLMDEERNTAGYLKVSVTIIGPNDKMLQHPESDEVDDENGDMTDLIYPPNVTKWKGYAVCSVLSAEHLLKTDSKSLTDAGGIDAYVKFELKGHKLTGFYKKNKTKVVYVKGERALLNPRFNSDIFYEFNIPSKHNMFVISVMDEDGVSDTCIGKIEVNIEDILAMRSEPFQKRWYNIYGAWNPSSGLTALKQLAEGNTKNWKDHYINHPDVAPLFTGRVLLGFRIEEKKNPNEDKQAFRLKIPPSLKNVSPPETTSYTLKLFLGYADHVPTNHLDCDEIRIKLNCGRYGEYSQAVSKSDKYQVFDFNSVIEITDVQMPLDVTQIPDIFVYLCKSGKSEITEYAYCRLTPSEALKKGNCAPEFFQFKIDFHLAKLKQKRFPGTLYGKLAFSQTKDWKLCEEDFNNSIQEYREALKDEPLQNYQVWVHLFQARNLPVMDVSSKALDPYVKVFLGGKHAQSKRLFKDQDPTFFETLSLKIEKRGSTIPTMIKCKVMDYDLIGDDEIAGEFDIILTKDMVDDNVGYDIVSTGTYPKIKSPSWYYLSRNVDGVLDNESFGRILVSVTAFKLPPELKPVTPPIEPETRAGFIEILAISCRDIRPKAGLNPQNPYLKFELSTANGTIEAETGNSKDPEPVDPNFFERILIPYNIPIDTRLIPMLRVSVGDTLFGGLKKITFGNASIDISSFAPWSPDFVPRVKPKTFPVDDVVEEPKGDVVVEESKGNDAVEESKGDKEADVTNIKIDTDDDVIEEEKSQHSDTLGTAMPEDDKQLSKKIDGKAEESIDKVQQGDSGAGVFGAMLHVDKDEFDMLPSATGIDDDSDEEEEEPKYLLGRKRLPGPWEESISRLPFDKYPIYAVSLGRKKVVAYLKCQFNIIMNEDDTTIDMASFKQPTNYFLRLYIMRVTNIAFFDLTLSGEAARSDPYLNISLGNLKFNGRKDYVADSTEIDHYKMYELPAIVPGCASLKIELKDYDLIGSDDIIGQTTIDIEDRFFESSWHDLGIENMDNESTTPRYRTLPIEVRPIMATGTTHPNALLECWIDVLKVSQCRTFVPDNIALPPSEIYEMRVVIWKTKDVVSMDDLTGMNDLFIKCWVEGCKDKKDTDTHWRCKKGNGSFNWRMKFDIELGAKTRSMKFPYFHIQMWDKDILKWNDCIAEGVLNLRKEFRKVHKKKQVLVMYQQKIAAATSQKALKNKSKKTQERLKNAKMKKKKANEARLAKEVQKTKEEGKEIEMSLISGEGDNNEEEEEEEDGDGDENEGEVTGDNAGAITGEPTEEEILGPNKEDSDTKAQINSFKAMTGLYDIDPENSTWIHLDRRNEKTKQRDPMGSVCISISILPKGMADSEPVGNGRTAPNQGPYLPPPTGRMKFSLNPFTLGMELCGPALCSKFFCCLICVGIMALMVFCQPVLNFIIAMVF